MEQLSERDFTRFLKEYSSARSTVPAPNTLDGKYRIETGRPLPEFDSSLAKAYAVSGKEEGGTALYALLLPMGIPYRHKTIEALKSIQHPSLIKCVAEGAVHLSGSGEARKAVIFEQPKGQPLSLVLKERQAPFPEQFILRSILAPLNEILQALQKHGINHGRINLDSIYLDGGAVTLCECVSEPSGYSQHFLFEPLDRAMAQPMGKGSGDMAGDCYALGVLACLLSLGGDPFSEMGEKLYLERILESGSYALLTHNRDLSEALRDLLRGALNDHKKERWTPDHIARWLGGKRYNLTPPPSLKEATRPVLFMEQEFYSPKALAESLHLHAASAHQILEDNRLARWAELSLRRKDMAERLGKLIYAAEDEKPQSQRMQFLVARTIIALDPSGPVRFGSLSSNIDGLGNILAEAYRSQSQHTVNDVALIIENDLAAYWSDSQTAQENPEATAMLWRMQKARMYLRHNSLGFGMERCLYDLNPSLPCQSELVISRHAGNVREALLALDALAHERHASAPPLDRHIAAFLASKLDIGKEQRISELIFDPNLSTNPKLVGLKLLALAQEKCGSPALPGLAHWVALHVFPILEHIHNREARQLVIEGLKKASASGKLAQMAYILFNARIYTSDQADFAKAMRLYQFNQEKIAHCRNPKVTAIRARNIGHKGALALGYAVLFATLYGVMQDYLNF